MKEIDLAGNKEVKPTKEALKEFAERINQLPQKPTDIPEEDAEERLTNQVYLQWPGDRRKLIYIPDEKARKIGIMDRAKVEVGPDSISVGALYLYSPSNFGRFEYEFKNNGEIISEPGRSHAKLIRFEDITSLDKQSIDLHIKVINNELDKYFKGKESK